MIFLKTRSHVFFVLLLLIVHCSQAQQLQITEITVEDWNLYDGDEWGNGWVELKNTATQPMSMKGTSLILNNEAPWPLPDMYLEANEYVLIWLSGKNRSNDKQYLHASFVISGTDNVVSLYDDINEVTLDSVVVRHNLNWNESRSRFPETSNNWHNTTLRTPRYENVSPGPWKRVTSSSTFSPRDSAPNAALYFDGKLWILEGWNGGGGEEAAASNTWSSVDGSDWQLVNDSPPYAPYASYIVFKDKMWAFDGNAYNSTDGMVWNKVATDLPFTTNNRVAELNDTLFLIQDKSIYKSPDGVVWSEVTSSAPWESRQFAGLVQFKNKLWMYGGGSGYNTGNDHYFNDVWSSEDGRHWIQVVEHAEWAGRLWFGFASFDNKMWMMGGWRADDAGDSYVGNKNDVWYTEDGVIWKDLPTGNTWQPRHAPFVWSTPDALYLSSGYLNNFGLLNDIWKLDKAENIIATTYYLKQGEDPIATESWGSTKSGNGISPKRFDYAYQSFVVENDHTISFDKNFSITGQSSNLLIGNGQDSVSVTVAKEVQITADLRLNGLTTIEFMGNQRTPLLRAPNETNKVILNKRVTLDALAIGQLVVKGSGNILARGTFIRKSATFLNDGTLTSDTRDLQYVPSSSLIVETSSNHMASSTEWPSKRSPGSVIINCNCIVSREGSAATENLILTSGKVRISNGVLSATHIVNATDKTYVITEENGYLETVVHAELTPFPIGTRNSYTPAEIKLTGDNPVGEPFGVSVFPIEDAINSEYAVNVGWKVLRSTSPVPEYEIVLHWDPRNEAQFAVPGSLILVTSDDKGNTTSRAGGAAKADQDLRIASSAQDEVGTYYIEDRRFNSEVPSITVFPNPSIDNVNIHFKSRRTTDVELQLLDITGQIAQSDVLQAGGRLYSLSWKREIPTGVYLLKLNTAEGVVTKKIVIR